jgi:hypothetical protein
MSSPLWAADAQLGTKEWTATTRATFDRETDTDPGKLTGKAVLSGLAAFSFEKS